MLAAVFGLVLLSACKTTHSITTDIDESVAQHVLSVEDEYVAAEVHRDEPTLRRILDDRFVYNDNDGTTSGKSELIRTVMGMSMTGQTLSERTILVDGDTALIFGTTELRFASDTGEESKSTLRYTSTYIKRHGQWRFLALQMTQRTAE